MIVYTYTQVILLKQAMPGTLSEENILITLYSTKDGIDPERGDLRLESLWSNE